MSVEERYREQSQLTEILDILVNSSVILGSICDHWGVDGHWTSFVESRSTSCGKLGMGGSKSSSERRHPSHQLAAFFIAPSQNGEIGFAINPSLGGETGITWGTYSPDRNPESKSGTA